MRATTGLAGRVELIGVRTQGVLGAQGECERASSEVAEDRTLPGFRRFSRGSLRESLRGWRARRSPVRIVYVAGRVRYAYHDDISFGFAWIQDGKAYFASSKHYGRFTWKDLRRMVASMRHLPGP